MLDLLYSKATNNEITRRDKVMVFLAIDLESQKSGSSDAECVIKHPDSIFYSLTLGQLL